mmetsp:Transcript_48127/g.112648  ORF Transcript_48127/g.112648 Transcript_48127/m.112648 type:complete len:201 (-) Transcript_48127:775-1377(-)
MWRCGPATVSEAGRGRASSSSKDKVISSTSKPSALERTRWVFGMSCWSVSRFFNDPYRSPSLFSACTAEKSATCPVSNTRRTSAGSLSSLKSSRKCDVLPKKSVPWTSYTLIPSRGSFSRATTWMAFDVSKAKVKSEMIMPTATAVAKSVRSVTTVTITITRASMRLICWVLAFALRNLWRAFIGRAARKISLRELHSKV